MASFYAAIEAVDMHASDPAWCTIPAPGSATVVVVDLDRHAVFVTGRAPGSEHVKVRDISPCAASALRACLSRYRALEARLSGP